MAQSERFHNQLSVISITLESALAEVRKGLGSVRDNGGLWERFVGMVEAFLDTGDAVRRRKNADKIYDDLVTERISHERAAVELLALNERQQGGWLYSRLTRSSRRTEQ